MKYILRTYEGQWVHVACTMPIAAFVVWINALLQSITLCLVIFIYSSWVLHWLVKFLEDWKHIQYFGGQRFDPRLIQTHWCLYRIHYTVTETVADTIQTGDNTETYTGKTRVTDSDERIDTVWMPWFGYRLALLPGSERQAVKPAIVEQLKHKHKSLSSKTVSIRDLVYTGYQQRKEDCE